MTQINRVLHKMGVGSYRDLGSEWYRQLLANYDELQCKVGW